MGSPGSSAPCVTSENSDVYLEGDREKQTRRTSCQLGDIPEQLCHPPWVGHGE